MHTSTPKAPVSPAKAARPLCGEPLLKLPAPPAPKTVKPTAQINAISRIVEVPYNFGMGEDLPPGRIEVSMSAPDYYRPRSEPLVRIGRHRLYGCTFRGNIQFGEERIDLDEVEQFVTALLEAATRTRLAILGSRVDEPGKDLATGGHDWDKLTRDIRALRELENADRDYGDEQPEGGA
ncbi:hypothetical protein C3942_00735 [Solimonas fluminis]|uniref:Uncharacterized protein n=1 Tax=Solimonas fluminis TaxID=2086571 RepID=A0A2S5TKF1_9GAMM|nr:hypothetical protein [Solimonas fluminis]PPE75454.1 hypothetical protein C3942_00735 [Solimonas fluminis]